MKVRVIRCRPRLREPLARRSQIPSVRMAIRFLSCNSCSNKHPKVEPLTFILPRTPNNPPLLINTRALFDNKVPLLDNNVPLLHPTLEKTIRPINLDASNQGKPYGNLRETLRYSLGTFASICAVSFPWISSHFFTSSLSHFFISSLSHSFILSFFHFNAFSLYCVRTQEWIYREKWKNEEKSLEFVKFVVILQLFSCRSLAFGWDWGREPIYRKGVLDALCLTLGNLAVPIRLSKTRQQRTSMRCIFMTLLAKAFIGLCYIVVYIQCVGFGVARFDKQAMPEPPSVGRVTRELPRFLFIP